MSTPHGDSPPMGKRWRRRTVAMIELCVGVFMLAGIWVALPARWWPVDAPGTLLGTSSCVAAIGLLRDARWAHQVSRVTLWALLLAGCAVCTALAWVVAHLSGLYGPVGAGGALLMGTMAVLLLPYLVLLPALSLRLLSESD